MLYKAYEGISGVDFGVFVDWLIGWMDAAKLGVAI